GIYAAEALVVLALLFVHDRGDVWIIYAVAVFYGAAGTFAASARSALMTVMLPQELLAESNGVLQTLREGLRLVAPLVGALIYAALEEGLHRPASFFGVLSSLQGVGAIAGGLTAARTMRHIGDVKLVGFGMVLLTVGDISLISHSLVLVLTGIAVAGAGIAWLIVGYATAIQLRTPLRLQGRVLSASDTLINTPQTVSIALGALLVSVVDYRLLVVVMGVVVVACGAYLLTREPEPVAEEDPVFA